MPRKKKEATKSPKSRMSKMNYSKFDRTFMAFGSICNALSGNPKTKREDIDWAWDSARVKVSTLVDDMSDEIAANEIPL